MTTTAEPFVFSAFELAAGEPLIRLHLGPDGVPAGATAGLLIAAPIERVWAVISDVDGYAGLIPMIHRIHREGDRVTVKLKFRISLFSVGFEFTADAVREEGRSLELRHVSGEPRALRLRFVLEPTPDGRTVLNAGIWFDMFSLGWLVKFFLKHHPEIQYGVFPGSAVVMVDSIRRGSEKR
jgi:hypothetical protein